jgi:hypothetical protein
MKPTLTLLLTLAALTSFADPGEIKLAWNASPSANVTGYFLYAHTNALTDTNFSYTIRADAGTNLTATIQNIASGQWYFAATARDTNGVESLLSNVLPYEIPKPPANMRTVILQYSGSVTNFQDVGFFKLRFP